MIDYWGCISLLTILVTCVFSFFLSHTPHRVVERMKEKKKANEKKNPKFRSSLFQEREARAEKLL